MKGNEKLAVPTVPTVTIAVDGKELNIPSQPLFATNDNGLTDSTHYQVYAPVKEGSVITAKASDPGVRFEIGRIEAGRAVVKATWGGMTKTFLVN